MLEEMTPLPLMRAAHVREGLERLEMFGELAVRIESRLGEHAASRIRESAASTWVPLELDLWLTRAVAEIAGADGLDAWCREAIRASIRGPLLRPVLEGATRIFGLSPRSIMGLVPRTFQHVYRNAGGLHRERDEPNRVAFSYRDAPVVVLDDDWYLLGIMSAIAVILEICEVGGTATLDRSGAFPQFVFESDEALDTVELRRSA